MAGRGAALVVVAGLAVAVGCSRTPVLDVGRVEAQVADRIEEDHGVAPSDVDCPDEVEVEDGGEFRCEVTVDDDPVLVEVTQTDGDGSLRIASTQAILRTEEVEADIAATLAERFGRDDVTVTCEGTAVRVERPRATFPCEAVDGEEAREVTVTVRDAQGALTYSVGDG